MQIKRSKKAQSAVESLMTYAWVIILVAAVIIVLFFLGVFSPLHFISPSPTISGFTGVKVTTVIANYTYVEFYLTNDLSVTVNLNKFLLTYNSSAFSDIHCQYLTLSPGQNSICFAKVKLANTRDTVSLGIGFAVSSHINASSNGTMSFVPADISVPLPSIITQFSEEGLPSGLQWWVDYKGINHSSTGTAVSFATVPGNYSFTVGNASLNGCSFTALPSSGYVEAGLVENIIFVNSCAATFIEKELPSGTKWQVKYAGVYNSSTSNLLVFTNEKSGTYSFSVDNSIVGGCIYQPSPSSGSLAVGQYQYIRFLGECTTTFTESGLPTGYNWIVTYEGVQKSNTTTVIYYFGSPGNYSYSVNTLSNSTSTPDCGTTYTPSPSSGKVAAGSVVSVTFSAETACTTTFTESGLPTGYNWKVTYDSITNNSNAPSNVVFVTKTSGSSIPTFSYSVPTLTNSSSTLDCTTTYTPSPSSGTAEAGTTTAISFSGSTSCITTFTETGLSSGVTWSVTYNGVDNSSTAPSDITFHTTTSGGGIPSYSYTINSISPNSSSTLDCTTATTPSPSSGTAEAGSTTAVSFSEKTTCITTFDESNLPTSYPWNVTFNNVEQTSTSSSMKFTTITPGGSIPSYSYSVPTLSASSVEWNFGTSSYQGDIYQGMPTPAFPSSLSDLNNNNVACSSPYDSQGYTAVAYMYFTSSITVTITTDDATAVFYAPAGSSSWSSVFGNSAWKGERATQYGPTTVSVTPGWYEVAVDWTNQCGPGMSAFEINGAYMTSNQFNVIGWTPSSNSVQLLPYSDVTANPADPSGITVEQTGSWAHQFNGYFTYTYTPSPSSNTVSAGSTNDISYSTSGSSSTEFYETGLPSGYTWSVSYDGQSGSASTGSPITLSLSGQSSQSSYTATASVSGLSCTSSDSVEEGTTYTFTSWSCTTTFNEAGLPSGTEWSVDYDGNTGTSTSSSLSVTFATSSISTQSFTVGNSGAYYPYPSSGSVEEGTTYGTTIQFTDTPCNTFSFSTDSNTHTSEYCVGGSETEVQWAGGNPGYIHFEIIGANGQTYASASSTLRCEAIQGLYALPLQAYYVYAGAGNGGGSCGNAVLNLVLPITSGGGTSGSSPLSISTSSTDMNGYICGGAAGNGDYTTSGCTASISEGYNSGTGGSSVGGAGSDSFSVSGSPDLAGIELGFNDDGQGFNTYTAGAAGTSGSVTDTYTVSSDYSPVLIMAASGWFGWNSISVPSGYQGSFFESDTYVNVAAYGYVAQNAGTYSVTVNGDSDSYISIEVLVFNPISPP